MATLEGRPAAVYLFSSLASDVVTSCVPLSAIIRRVLGLVQCSHDLFDLLWIADTPHAATFDDVSSAHTNFLPDQVSPHLSRSDANPAADSRLLIEVADRVPPADGFDALSSK